jgi:tetratricopeptide (TPR) repeat protein/predicted small secreted protein
LGYLQKSVSALNAAVRSKVAPGNIPAQPTSGCGTANAPKVTPLKLQNVSFATGSFIKDTQFFPKEPCVCPILVVTLYALLEACMKSLCLYATIAIVSFPLAAQSTGRIAGKIVDSAGKPITNASVTMRRTDTNVTRNIKVDSKGAYSQVGLEPYEFELVVTAEGYVGHKEIVKISVGLQVVKDVTLLKNEEVNNPGGQPKADAAGAKSNEAAEAYNRALKLFNEKKYADALKDMEFALETFKAAIVAAEAQEQIQTLEKNVALTAKMLALCHYEIGKADREKRNDMWLLAEPALKENFEQAQDDAYVAQALAEIANMRGDKGAESKYLDAVDRIAGPQAEVSYNRAVDLFNDGNYAEAKKPLKRAIEIDPKMSEPYYLLAICEYSDGDIKAAKSLLEKYLQLDPKGKYAEIVKEMLSDPSFK